MAGNFTVDPEALDARAGSLSTIIAPAYSQSATAVGQGSQISTPGFGIVLAATLGAIYEQKVDYCMKDLQGAHDVVAEIATRLKQTAEEFRRSENLNVAGFDGTPKDTIGYGTAVNRAGLGGAAAVTGAAGLITAAAIYVTAGTLATCAGLCPTFIPGVLAAAGFVSNPVGIAEAGSQLIAESHHVKDEINSGFADFCGNAASGWTGEGRDAFVTLSNKIKTHLDQIGDYLATLGSMLHDLALGLGTLWLGLAGMAGPFLIWLIAMRAAEAIPFAAAAIEPVIEISGTLASTAVLTTTAAVLAVGSLVVSLLSGLGKDLISLGSLPDGGKSGVPDMTEFHVGLNFQTSI